ncbi:MAG: hypothetical protein WCZ13_01180 [Acholeplasmataceae bacterium]
MRNKYVYTIYEHATGRYLEFFSSLDRALQFALSNGLNVKAWDYNDCHYMLYTGKKSAAYLFRLDGKYYDDKKHTHIFVKIRLDGNGTLNV